MGKPEIYLRKPSSRVFECAYLRLLLYVHVIVVGRGETQNTPLQVCLFSMSWMLLTFTYVYHTIKRRRKAALLFPEP